MKKISKTEKIRIALKNGDAVKDIAKALKVKPAYVYSVRWHLKGGKKGKTTGKKLLSKAKQGLGKSLTEALRALQDGPTDPISPDHYKIGGIETHHFIEAKGMAYNVGTAVAYLSRAHHKGRYLEDIKKAAKHLEFEIIRIENPPPIV